MIGLAVERTAGHDIEGRQKIGEGTGGRALGGSLLPANEQPTDARMNRAHAQGRLQTLLADDGRKWIIHDARLLSTDFSWCLRLAFGNSNSNAKRKQNA